MIKWKYQIIEYGIKSMTYGEGGTKIDYAKTLHKTNSWLLCMFICLLLKINRIKYDRVVK